MRIPAFLMLALSVPVIFDAQAQDETEPIPQDVYTWATPVIDPEPSYPELAWLNAWEGWVTYSYIITTEGKVTSLIIEDSSGYEEFEEAVLKAVPRRLYKPATLNGVPVEESVRNETFVFDAPLGDGVRREFKRSLDEIERHIVNGDLELAGAIVEEIGSSRRTNLYEDAWYWWMKFVYSAAAGEVEDAELINLLRKAVGFGRSKLPVDTTMAALESYYMLRVRQNNFGSAIRVYEVMRDSVWAKRSAHYQRILDTHTASYEHILDLVDSDTPILQRGQIGERGNTIHELWRRVFFVNEVEGALDTVSIRCDRGNSEHSYEPGNVWRIPENWGVCDVYLLGEPDTKFTLVELLSVP